MSCDWRFECATCRVSHPTERNHGERAMASILAARPALARLSAELKAQAGLLGDLADFLGDGLHVQPVLGLAAWFAAHQGHHIRLISEDGRVYGPCNARVPCVGGCGHDRYCALELGHQGGHDPDGKAAQTSARER